MSLLTEIKWSNVLKWLQLEKKSMEIKINESWVKIYLKSYENEYKMNLKITKHCNSMLWFSL